LGYFRSILVVRKWPRSGTASIHTTATSYQQARGLLGSTVKTLPLPA